MVEQIEISKLKSKMGVKISWGASKIFALFIVLALQLFEASVIFTLYTEVGKGLPRCKSSKSASSFSL